VAIAAATQDPRNPKPDHVHVPDGVWIYADIEQPFKPSKDWILGWWDAMASSRLGGVGGLYCDCAPINSWFNDPYCAAFQDAKGKGLPIDVWSILWAQTPALGCGADPNNPGSAADSPKKCHLNGTGVWQYAIGCYRIPNIVEVDLDLANDRGINSMWPPPV
jgi:hypothetical protein